MELKLVLEFIKKYWIQSLIAILIATIFYLNISNSLLESKLALAEQKNMQIEERLKVSNASVEQLKIKLNEQNEKLEQLGIKTQNIIESSQKALQETLKENNKLQEKIDKINNITYDDSKDECYNLKQLLKNVEDN